MNRILSMSSGRSSYPQSFITKGKQRLKQDYDTVYLNNGDEFEIELFNPTHNKVLAKIQTNGDQMGSIVLRPGERIFLDRFLDEPKKLKFDTYFINPKDAGAVNATTKNGDILIHFFDEIKPNIVNSNGIGSTLTWTNYPSPYTYTTHNTLGGYTGSITTTSTTTSSFLNSTLTSNVSNLKNILPSATLETGRVERGSKSNQTFIFDDSSFSSTICNTNWWRLVPKSSKALVREDLVTYCTECGSRKKKDTHKFCPHCGTKF